MKTMKIGTGISCPVDHLLLAPVSGKSSEIYILKAFARLYNEVEPLGVRWAK